MRINLSSGYVRMAQECLDMAQRSAILEQVSSEGVAQGVGGYSLAYSGPFPPQSHPIVCLDSGQPFPPPCMRSLHRNQGGSYSH